MSSNLAVKKWRKDTKERIIDSMGGCCQICGYSKCSNALELHHIKSDEKEFSFGAIRASPKSWNKIVEELRKCVLLCANCHRELHAGLTELPDSYETFDDEYEEYRKPVVSYCPVCNNEKPNRNKTCSNKCMGILNGKVDWNLIDLKSLLERFSYSEIGRQIGVSDVSVRKRAKKLQLV